MTRESTLRLRSIRWKPVATIDERDEAAYEWIIARGQYWVNGRGDLYQSHWWSKYMPIWYTSEQRP